MADGGINVVARPHPFKDDRVYAEFLAGQTIAAMLGGGVSRTARVEIGGVPVPSKLWGCVRPKPGTTVHVTLYPQGGNAGKWVKIIAIAVITYYTYGAGSSSAAAAFGMSATELEVVGTLAIMAVNALIPPPSAKGISGGNPFSQLTSLTGTSNQANQYGPVPCVVGEFRFFPPHAALPYTEISGSDQYLRMLLDIGLGADIDVSDIRIGDTDIADYTDVEYEISRTPTLFTQDIYELTVGSAYNADLDTATRTTQTNVTEISLDLNFPAGLFSVSPTGVIQSAAVYFDVQYRVLGSSTWLEAALATGLTYSNIAISTSSGGSHVQVLGNLSQTLRVGMRWTVAAAQYEVRITRIGSYVESVTASSLAATWTVLRSISPQLPSTTGTLKLALRIKATDQLNGVVQTLSVLASQRIRTWDGTAFTGSSPSTNPAEVYYWLLTQCPAVLRQVADDRMDTAVLGAWAEDCATRGLNTSFVMDSARALENVVQDVMAVGRAAFGMRNGLYSAVLDLPQTVPMQMFTPANSSGFSYTRQFATLPHALRVKFINPEASYQADERVVYADGYNASNATLFEALDASMCTDPNAAWKLGRYHLSVIYNRMTQYSFTADVENLACGRGDLIRHAHDLTGWGLAWGRVRSVSGTRVVLDEAVTFQSGVTYEIQIRGQDAVVNDSNVASEPITFDTTRVTFDESMVWDDTGTGTTNVVLLATALSVNPGDLYVLGEVTQVTSSFLVREVKPGAELSATLTCVDAAPAVWTADAGTPPIFVSSITGQSWCAAPPIPVLTVTAGTEHVDDAGITDRNGVFSDSPTSGIYRIHVFNQVPKVHAE